MKVTILPDIKFGAFTSRRIVASSDSKPIGCASRCVESLKNFSKAIKYTECVGVIGAITHHADTHNWRRPVH